VAKLEWGSRYVCFSCGCKFYDLNRPEPLCPRCDSDQREATQGARVTRPSRVLAGSAEEEPEGDVVEEPAEMGLDQEEPPEEGEEEDEEEEEVGL
jgi:hypothetical protein